MPYKGLLSMMEVPRFSESEMGLMALCADER